MKNKTPKLAALMAIMLPMAAGAVPVQSDTSAFVTFRDCIPGVTACDGFTAVVASDIDGSPGDLTAAASLQDNAYGAVNASAQLSGVAAAPVLTASSSSAAGKRLGANTVAMQRYTYTGMTSKTLTYYGGLAYSLFLPTEPSLVGSSVSAQLFVFSVDDPAIDVGSTEEENFNSLFVGAPILNAGGFTVLGFDEFSDAAATAAGFSSLSITFDVDPGDSFWAYALLQAISTNGATADSLYITAFSDTEYLVPANTIPEPGTLALLGLGLAGMGFARRRKNA